MCNGLAGDKIKLVDNEKNAIYQIIISDYDNLEYYIVFAKEDKKIICYKEKELQNQLAIIDLNKRDEPVNVKDIPARAFWWGIKDILRTLIPVVSE